MYEQKMYSITLRHLNGLNKGIQAVHSVVEYHLKYGDKKEYQRWARKDKNKILMEAGSTEILEKAVKRLRKYGVRVAEFHEPDLGNIITSISFLLDETVWNKQRHTDVDGNTALLRDFMSKFDLARN